MHADPAPLQQTPTHQFLRLLRRVERMAPADLVFHQAQRIEQLVRHAREHVPFYRERLRPVFDADDVLDLSGWKDVPILSSEEARANADALRAAEVPALAGKAHDDMTTGSSGKPFHFLRSTAARGADAANSLRIFLDHRFDANARFADIRLDAAGTAQPPDGALRPRWAFGQGSGDYALLDINAPLPQQVDWLLRMRPAILFTWPSNVRAIALHLERTGQRLPLTSLATSAEIQTDGARRDCRRVFGLDPVDVLGAREIGILAWRCHASPLYHLTAESTFVEVLTDDGEPAEPGEVGRLVATSFYGFHMPFIRYATGDYVRLAERSCRCGRSLPTLSAILGRDRNRLRRRDGRRAFPTVPEDALDALIGPLQWRLGQKPLDRITVFVPQSEIDRALGSSEKIAAEVRQALGDEFLVEVAAAEAPSRGVWRRKHELFRSEIGAAGGAGADAP